MLDDSVMLAKKMRKLGMPVHLDVLDDLPHGFLNFVLLSQDAKAGSDLCILRIKELLGMTTINDDEFEVLRDGSPANESPKSKLTSKSSDSSRASESTEAKSVNGR